ncbi:MAG: cupin domain-containing protein [Kiloniellales bacterium]|nr:cupin domain-containing protein [Kiloniellales bacterium]
MVKAVDIHGELAKLTMLRGRRPDTPGDQTAAAFATLAAFREGGIFAGSFQGDSAWERHTQGDELVQILDGAATLTVLTGEGPQVLEMKAGMLAVVPQNCWHRFSAPEGVSLMTATPQPTDHSTAEDPRQDG